MPSLYFINDIYEQRMTSKGELKKKYESSSTFKKEMEKADENYRKIWQRAYYSSLDPNKESFIKLFKGQHKMGMDIYFIEALGQETQAPTLDKLAMYFIHNLPSPSRNYILVYFNNEDNSNAFTDFKDMLEILPYPYFMNLYKILLVKPTFGQKASRYFSFGVITKFLNSHLEYADNLKELGEKICVSVQEIEKALSPSSQVKFNEENKNKVKKEITQNEKKEHGPQITIKEVEKKKFEISEYEKGDSAIPVLFQTLVYYFKQHPEGLKLEGLFRKSVNVEEEAQINTQMSKKHYDCIEQIENPHIVANLIKRFLSELATPIIPYEIFYDLMECPNLTAEYICNKMKDLGKMNITKLLTLLFFLEFILTSVLAHAEENKMTTLNISICLAPCLMRASEVTMKEILYAKKSVEVLAIMLNNFEEVFGNRKDQKQLYRSSYFQHRKKSMKEMLSDSEKKKEEFETIGNNKAESSEEEEAIELVLEKTKSEVESYWSESEEEFEELNIHSTFKKKSKTEEILPPSTKEISGSHKVLDEAPQIEELNKKGVFTENLSENKEK